MSLWVGIDFGTSNSGVAVPQDGGVRVLPLDPANIVPEVVKTILYVTRDNQAYIGQEAVELYYRQNIGRIRSMTRKWVGEIDVYGGDMFFVRDVYAYVDEMAPGRLLQYLKTALRTPGYDGTRIFERFYTTTEMAALYLRELKRRAETQLGQAISGVVLGRPVKFSDDLAHDRRAEQALGQAARSAGFSEVRFELEPVAAALDYEQRLRKPQTTLIFDFGGGTLDITILRLGDPADRAVYASGGVGIAGSDFDRVMIERRMLRHFGKGFIDGEPELQRLIETVSDWMALPDQSTPAIRHRLQQAAAQGKAPIQMKALETLIFNDLAFSFYRVVEEAKIALSTDGSALIRLKEPDLNLWELYTRWQFERDIRVQRERIEAVLLDTLRASGLKSERIDAVVTTGGSSSIPVFNQMLAQHFGADKLQRSDAFSSVTAGLGLRAAQHVRG